MCSSDLTEADGSWKVTGLRAGDYTITETQPAMLVDGSATVGNAGGMVGSPNTITITLQPGVTASGYSFGDVRRALPVTGGSPMRLLEVASLFVALGVALRLGRRKVRSV